MNLGQLSEISGSLKLTEVESPELCCRAFEVLVASVDVHRILKTIAQIENIFYNEIRYQCTKLRMWFSSIETDSA